MVLSVDFAAKFGPVTVAFRAEEDESEEITKMGERCICFERKEKTTRLIHSRVKRDPENSATMKKCCAL